MPLQLAADSHTNKGRSGGAPFLFVGLCALLLWGAAGPLGAGEPCRTTRVDEAVQVAQVHDGDSLRLSDGRKLRLIGINTPELGRDHVPAEPLAREARRQLLELLGDEPGVTLRYGPERRDRHGRLLAHVFSRNGVNLGAQLLRDGYAMALAIPPNLELLPCYLDAEREAARAGRGIWSHPWFEPLDGAALAKVRPGFRRVAGRVTAVKHTAKSIWLTLDTPLALRIAREDSRYFATLAPESLAGRAVVARGWLTRRHGRWQMRIRHPAALELRD